MFTAAPLFAQTRQSNKTADSAAAARKKALDLQRAERQRITDSTVAVRKHYTDSLAAIRKYRESKKYKDSVAKAREARTSQLRAVQKARFDSLKATRQKATDSLFAARKEITDKLHAVQKHRADSLATIRKYKESKRYRDSVAIVRQGRMDSMRLARKHVTDSAMASRKAITEQLTRERKRVSDSLTALRAKRADSLKLRQKAREENLAKAKVKKQNEQKTAEKNQEKKAALALELKIKKKHEQYDNNKMLKKKWSMPRKIVQNTFTRYNYYFNADRRMDDALLNMQRLKKDNYDSLIALFPFDPDRDSTTLAPDMDSIIMKASLGIQIHDPRTKWGDDLYLLLGQAYFYKGNYKDAASSFRYIISLKKLLDKNKKKPQSVAANKTKSVSIAEAEKKSMLDFLKHQTVHNEALLWLSRTFVQSNKLSDAEAVMDLLNADPNFPEDLRGRLALEKAFLYLKEKNPRGSIEQLTIVAADDNLPQWVRLRSAYLTGQLQQQQGDYATAANSFNKVIDLSPKIEMDFYAHKQLAYSLMYAGGDQQDAIASLKHLLNDGKYGAYYEQIYFVLGRLSANSNNNKDAITYLRKSIEAPKSTKKQKAISFATIGNVYYRTGDYTMAKKAYDSAAYLASHAGGDSIVVMAARRSKSLDEVAVPYNTIKNQDSLLALAAMPEKDQRAVIRKYIKYLEKQREDSIYRAENPTAGGVQDGGNANDNSAYGNWYFTNAGQMQQGFNDFKRKWGQRPAVDNWRRTSALGFASGSNNNNNSADDKETDGEGNATAAADLDERGIPTESGLYAFIPATREKKEQSELRIQRAYVDMANAYIRQLEDYPNAIKAMDTLDARYPKHQYAAELLYMRYIVALRTNRLPDAQRYSARLQQDYANTKYAGLVKPTEDAPVPDAGKVSVATYYDETYDLLMNHQYTQVLQRVKTGRNNYNDNNYNNRFSILEATALIGVRNYELADSLLDDFIRLNAADSLAPHAAVLRQYITDNKPKPAPADTAAIPAATADAARQPATAAAAMPNTSSTVLQPASATSQPTLTAPVKDSASLPVPPVPVPVTVTEPQVPASYTFKPNEEHYFILAFDKMETRVMALKSGINDFDNLKYGNQGLSSKIDMLKGQQGLIQVKGFNNATQAKIYANAIRSTAQLFRDFAPSDYQIYIISAKNYLKLLNDRDIAAYKQYYKSKYH